MRAAAARLAQPSWRWQRGEGQCAGALAEVRRLHYHQGRQLKTELDCRIAADCSHSCPVPGLNDTEWTATTLAADRLRRPILSQQLRAVWHITTAIIARWQCNDYTPSFRDLLRSNKTEFLEVCSSHWRDRAQLLPHLATHLSQLFVGLAFELIGEHTNDQHLQGWIKSVEHLRDMLHTKLSGWAHDVQYAGEHMLNYTIEENETSPGEYIFRRPLLSENLLKYQERFLSFGDDFTAVCEERQPNASQLFSLAETLYSFWYENWFNYLPDENYYDFDVRAVDEEWQVEDRSSDALTADTGCLQLLADALDRPTCPLEDLPPETVQQRQQCRRQLWDDMVQRSPHIPVTSYLAYTQRATVPLCLLAWMAANSFGVCQDVPFSVIQSVHDARCYFDRPGVQSCLISNATDAICVVSRAILLLKCRDFSSNNTADLSSITFRFDESSIRTFDIWGHTGQGDVKPTDTTLNYKDSLNSATLKYKDFKIDNLKPLEIGFITVNLLFRTLTAAVYVYLPQCRNLPGKIFLSFQITAIAQILCSEIVYRNAGVPNLPAMVLIDSSLTLLGCLWLNSFCYQMYACVRDLRLPNDLSPDEASLIFRRQVLYALILCSIVSTTCTTLEKTSNYYLIFSRIVFIVVISLSVTFNVICLGLIGYIHIRNKKLMRELRIYTKEKFASKKQLVFMSVKTIILSGIGIIIRIGFHQAEGIAQFVYYVHIATMMQGPVLFLFFICNGTTLPVLRRKLRAWYNLEAVSPDEELCSAAERNLARRTRDELSLAAETSL